jgi:hypothetical protein
VLTQAKLKSVPHFLGLAKIHSAMYQWALGSPRQNRQNFDADWAYAKIRSSLAQCKEKFVRVDSVNAKLKHVVLLSTVITHQKLFPRMPSLSRNYWNSILWGKSNKNYLTRYWFRTKRFKISMCFFNQYRSQLMHTHLRIISNEPY